MSKRKGISTHSKKPVRGMHGRNSTTEDLPWSVVEYLTCRPVDPCFMVVRSLFDGKMIIWEPTIRHNPVWSLFTLDQPVYPSLVSKFYARMQLTEEDVIRTTLGGITIVLDEAIVGEILCIPPSGLDLYTAIAKDLYIAANVVTGSSRMIVSDSAELSADNFLLHDITRRILVPISAPYYNIFQLDLLMLGNFIIRETVNIPRIVLKEMIASVRQRRRSLPYGSVLTSVFNHYSVPISGGCPSRPTDKFDGLRLSQMRLVLDPHIMTLVRLHTWPLGSVPRMVSSMLGTLYTTVDGVEGRCAVIEQQMKTALRQEKKKHGAIKARLLRLEQIRGCEPPPKICLSNEDTEPMTAHEDEGTNA